MTRVGSGLIHLKRLISSDWIVYALVSVTIISVSLETGIIRISGFEDTGISTYSLFFVGLSIFCIISQLIILKFVGNKVNKFLESSPHLHLSKMKKGIVAVQISISVLIIIILLEIMVTYSYHTFFLIAVLMISFLTAAVITALLSLRFIIWLKSNKNRIIGTYLFATLFISLSSIAGVAYFLDQLLDAPSVVHAQQYADFIRHVATGNSSLVYFFTIFSAVAFVLLWLGTVFMLQSYRKKIGKWKYWIVMSIPLLYFLSQFQPAILNFLLSYASNNPALFNIIYIIMVHASRPIGGVLFGIAFILVARRIENLQVKGYLVVSGIGLLLLLVSYQAQALIGTPYPPLGLLSASYFGLSSYLIFVGIYSSALSISQDSKLRASIRRSIDTEVSFLKGIGNAEMNHRIFERVLQTSRNISEILPEESGISSSLTEEEIKDYVQAALELALKKKSQKVN
jgi:hypothetical protein